MSIKFHLHKKVITWPQLYSNCNKRELSRLCTVREEDTDKTCKLDDQTKARCPIWNCHLENLAIIKSNRRTYAEERNPEVSKTEKRFREDG